MSSKLVSAILAFMFAAGACWAQEKQEKKEKPASTSASAPTAPSHGFTFTAEDDARKNPNKFTQTSTDRGKKIYVTQCALCHGKDGDGKGELAEEMKLTMPDLTKAETLTKRTDGALFAIIGSGSEPMPGQAGRMTDQQRWNLVNYLRVLAGKKPEKATGKEAEENVILVPQ
jgi:mono/diheme cytochrome c family protein